MRQGLNCTSARLFSPGFAHEKRHPSKENPDQHPGSLVDHPWLIIKGGGVNFLLWDLQATKWSPFFNKSLQTPLTPTDRKIDGPESPFVQSKCNKMIWYNWWNEIVTQTLADWSSHSPQQKTVSVSLTQPSYTKWYVCGIAMHFATEGNLSVKTLTSSIDIFCNSCLGPPACNKEHFCQTKFRGSVALVSELVFRCGGISRRALCHWLTDWLRHLSN